MLGVEGTLAMLARGPLQSMRLQGNRLRLVLVVHRVDEGRSRSVNYVQEVRMRVLQFS